MNKKKYPIFIAAGVLLIVAIFFIVSYNSLVKKEEKVKLQWNEMQNAYQRRLDLIPSLVNTVKGTAEFEQTTLQEIAEARAKAASVTISGDGPVADQYQQQTNAQNELAGAANHLLIKVEKYPTLQGTAAFRGLQAQLEGTERRIKFARKDFNAAVADYNSSVRGFPTKIVAGMFGFRARDGFTADEGSDQSKEIKF
jgi:LemA protein